MARTDLMPWLLFQWVSTALNLFLAFVFLVERNRRKFPTCLIGHFFLSVGIFNAVDLFPGQVVGFEVWTFSPGLCSTLSVVRNYFSCSGTFFALLIAVNFYLLLVKESPISKIYERRGLFYAFGYIGPMVPTLIMAVSSEMAPLTVYCWVKGPNWVVIVGRYGVLFTNAMIGLILSLMSARALRRRSKHMLPQSGKTSTLNSYKQYEARIVLFGLMFGGLVTLASFKNFVDVISGARDPTLVVSSAERINPPGASEIAPALIGVLFGLVFGISKDIWTKFLPSLCCCRRESDNSELSTTALSAGESRKSRTVSKVSISKAKVAPTNAPRTL